MCVCVCVVFRKGSTKLHSFLNNLMLKQLSLMSLVVVRKGNIFVLNYMSKYFLHEKRAVVI